MVANRLEGPVFHGGSFESHEPLHDSGCHELESVKMPKARGLLLFVNGIPTWPLG